MRRPDLLPAELLKVVLCHPTKVLQCPVPALATLLVTTEAQWSRGCVCFFVISVVIWAASNECIQGTMFPSNQHPSNSWSAPNEPNVSQCLQEYLSTKNITHILSTEMQRTKPKYQHGEPLSYLATLHLWKPPVARGIFLTARATKHPEIGWNAVLDRPTTSLEF